MPFSIKHRVDNQDTHYMPLPKNLQNFLQNVILIYLRLTV